MVDLIGQPVHKIFNTSTKFLLCSPNFSIHPCKASESVSPGPVLPNLFYAANSTTSSLISAGIKRRSLVRFQRSTNVFFFGGLILWVWLPGHTLSLLKSIKMPVSVYYCGLCMIHCDIVPLVNQFDLFCDLDLFHSVRFWRKTINYKICFVW